jgi:hypothetical protein
MEVAFHSFLFFKEAIVGLEKVGMAGILGDLLLTFVSIEVSSLADQVSFKLLFVELLLLKTHVDEHGNTLLNVKTLNLLMISLLLDLAEHSGDQLFLD